MLSLRVLFVLLAWGAQEEESYELQLRKHLASARGFSDEQLRAIADLIARKTAALPNPSYRAKLRKDAKDYVLSRASADALVLADPLNAEGPRVDVFRGEASMAVFQHELAFRLDRAAEGPKPEQVRRESLDQINLLAASLNGRLQDLVEGPGARGFVESSVERFKAYMGYLATSDLEFPFRTPLTPAQLDELRLRLATFSPTPSQIPDKTKPLSSSAGKVWVEDPLKRTYQMNLVTDFGAFALVESHLARLYTPPELMDERYQALRKKMAAEQDELTRALGDEDGVEAKAGEPRWYVGKERPPGPSTHSPSGAAAGSAKPSAPLSRDGGGRRWPWFVAALTLAAVLVAWIARRGSPR